MKWQFALVLLLSAPSLSVFAEPPADAAGWLGRVVSAAQRLNYTGTFIYQSGSRTEISRITHVVEGGVERERLEVLDGSPREVVRVNDEVKCYLPSERVVVVEQQSRHTAFPALPPESAAGLAQYYKIRKGEMGRVAGYDSHMLVLEPKDNFRYGQVLWAEANTGLLLRARTVNEKGEPVEQFAFTQLQIGGNIDRESLKPKFDKIGDWRVRNAKALEGSQAEDSAWAFRAVLPGFKRSPGMKRQFQSGAGETMHYVFSDGMAAISVFIERLQDKSERRSGFLNSGATQVYQRVTGDYLVTALGEVPPRALKTLADGVEAVRK